MEISGQYLEYSEYTSLGGTLEETPFSILEYNARMKIDERTFGRLKNLDEIPEEVKMCVFSLIRTLDSYSSYAENNKNITSESIDGYSISYKGASKDITEAMNKEVEDIINTYLSNVLIDNIPVLFRGVR